MNSTMSSRPTRQLVVLGAVCLAALTLPLAFSTGAVATPAIGRDLGGSTVAMNWITNAFMLAFGSLLMAAGTLADRYLSRPAIRSMSASTQIGQLRSIESGAEIVDDRDNRDNVRTRSHATKRNEPVRRENPTRHSR